MSACTPNYPGVNASEQFSVVVLPDMQYEIKSFPSIFDSEINWIVDNKEKMNIQFVVGEGDIVNNANDAAQWKRASAGYAKLENSGIPYLIVPGNHDYPLNNYLSYFPLSRISKESTFGGAYNSSPENEYHLLTVNNKTYLFMGLEFCPSTDEIVWANETLKKYNNITSVFVTHGFLDINSERSINVCNSTEYIWEGFIKHHPNLQVVLCGHMHGEAIRTDKNLAGKNVYQMLANYQSDLNGGNGWIRILIFSSQENKVYVQTYSPYLKEYSNESASNFSIDLD